MPPRHRPTPLLRAARRATTWGGLTLLAGFAHAITYHGPPRIAFGLTVATATVVALLAAASVIAGAVVQALDRPAPSRFRRR